MRKNIRKRFADFQEQFRQLTPEGQKVAVDIIKILDELPNKKSRIEVLKKVSAKLFETTQP